jgi:CHAT domain-containing protein
MALFESSDLVHVAAHGAFRADSPLFSSLRAVDGPLTVYDLEHLRRVPSTVVLSACDAATAAALAGDELLGTSAALLGLGVASIVAAVGLVPDAATGRFMVALHGALAAGVAVADALALARSQAMVSDDPGDRAAAALFLCLGSGRS